MYYIRIVSGEVIFNASLSFTDFNFQFIHDVNVHEILMTEIPHIVIKVKAKANSKKKKKEKKIKIFFLCVETYIAVRKL